MTLRPRQLKLNSPELLQIDWSDGQVRQYTVRELRENCPCATCREKRRATPPPATMLPILKAEETQPLRITKMEPQGHYAYAIHFSDGHNTGIYTLESLHKLGATVNP
jgi:DUF971 family protein